MVYWRIEEVFRRGVGFWWEVRRALESVLGVDKSVLDIAEKIYGFTSGGIDGVISAVEVARRIEHGDIDIRVKLEGRLVEKVYSDSRLEVCNNLSIPVNIIDIAFRGEGIRWSGSETLPIVIGGGECRDIDVSIYSEYAGSIVVELGLKLDVVGVGLEKNIPLKISVEPRLAESRKEVREENTTGAGGETSMGAGVSASVFSGGFVLGGGFPEALGEFYEVLEFVGEGGFGRVWRVRRRRDGRVVAVKVPLFLDWEGGRLFLREAGLWLTLIHENIVRLFDANIIPVPYLEMEFVSGVRVGGRVVRGVDGLVKPVSVSLALRIVGGVLRGLDFAHSRGIVHLDLKPHNILLAGGLVPKISDWGLARVLGATTSKTTGKIYLSMIYAAPEQIDKKRFGGVDPRTDLYQVGAVLYELLTGRPPVGGDTPVEVMASILYSEPEPPSKFNPSVPGEVEELVLRLLAKRKEDRPGSAREVFNWIEKYTRGLSSSLEVRVEDLKKTLKHSVGLEKKQYTRLAAEALAELIVSYIDQGKLGDALIKIEDFREVVGDNREVEEVRKRIEYLYRERVGVEPGLAEDIRIVLLKLVRRL